MSSTDKIKRILYLDQLRALAIITIIFVHVSNIWGGVPVDSFNWYVRDLFKIIGFTGVPLFFMLSGSLLLNKNYEIKEFFQRRFPRVLYPYLFWMVIFIIVAVIVDDKFHLFNSLAKAVPYIIKSFTANYWFVWMIIGMYLAMPVINEFIKNKGLKGAEYFILLLFITTILISFSKIFHYSLHYMMLALFFFAGPIGFAVLGYYLRFKEFKFTPRTMMIAGLALFFASLILKIIFTWKGWFIQPMFKYYVFHSKSFLYTDLLTLLQPIGIFIFFKYLNESKQGISKKISTFLSGGIIERLTVSLSKASYGIFLIQIILINLLGLLALKLPDKNALKWIPFLIIVVLVISWSILVILDRIPYMKKFSGYH